MQIILDVGEIHRRIIRIRSKRVSPRSKSPGSIARRTVDDPHVGLPGSTGDQVIPRNNFSRGKLSGKVSGTACGIQELDLIQLISGNTLAVTNEYFSFATATAWVSIRAFPSFDGQYLIV